MIKRGFIVLLGLSALAGPAAAGDWPYWRGPEQSGATREKAVVTDWSPDGKNLLWKSDVGGRTTPIVLDGRVYVMGPVGEGECSRERVACLDADTGKTRWEHVFNVFDTDIVENRVGWPALVGDPQTGNVYAHGTGGEFFCYNRDGKVLWQHSMTEMYGRISGYGGRLMTPIIDEDRVIVSFLNTSWGNLGRPLHRYVAFDKRTGDILWWAAPGGAPLDTTYATPAVTVINGMRVMVAPNADGNVYGLAARTGERLWTYRLSKRGLNTSVVVDANRAYVSQSEENLNTTEMGAIVCIDASQSGDITDSGTVWRHDGYTVGYASPALANGRLYCVDNSATLYALDAATGEIFWEYSLGRVGKGSPTVTADGVIYVGEQNGTFSILRDGGDKCTLLSQHTFDRADGLVDEIFGSPAIADGRVYFMTRYGTYCLGKPGAEVETTDAPPSLDARVRAADDAWSSAGGGKLFLVPAEVTLKPGEQVTFSLGQYTPETIGAITSPGRGLEWKLDGIGGELTGEGDYTAPREGLPAVGLVTCTVEGAKAEARVRVLPELPAVYDFENVKPGGAPAGWLGVGGGKVRVVEQDGGRVLQKVASKERPSPPFMRLTAYTTTPLPIGYTVQCDLKSELKDAGRRAYLPDMGLWNCRYLFSMLGADKPRGRKTQLRIESWGAVPRLRKDVEFDWDPDQWYTVRFVVQQDGQRSVCRAKVWPRGSAEPDAWQIEVTDECPNLEGSAGLYCYSTGTTVSSDGPATCFDNYKVYRDE